MTSSPPGLGRLTDGRQFPVDEYEVITIDGVRVGCVRAVLDGALVVQGGAWPFRRNLRLPFESAVVRDVDRTVITLISADQLERLPRVSRATLNQRPKTGDDGD